MAKDLPHDRVCIRDEPAKWHQKQLGAAEVPQEAFHLCSVETREETLFSTRGPRLAMLLKTHVRLSDLSVYPVFKGCVA
eukprot:CAMPEP_0118981384 /NCGR_PEP_ID=MMETSP1173-20130426/30461_1 /TAXON_ID=1034831 /ORGANISM="Rhizochromulina marina cf, Strain CCMP1243" /LENGTH=78 /DNA_ID=CAMNT_0006931791 /DNA_START=214 /DNA_END=450 /DNA_ORIENTATION=+